MELTREELARRLRSAREKEGLTQAAVGEQMGVHRPTVSEIEAGRRSVSSEEIVRLSRIYRVPVHVLLAGPVSGAEEVEELLGSEPAFETHEARECLRGFLARCTSERKLEATLQIEPSSGPRPRYEVPGANDRAEAARQGRMVADAERRRLQMSGEPLKSPAMLLSCQGLRIGWLPKGALDLLDGIFFESHDLGAWVGVSREAAEPNGPGAAFVVAHAYAHWLLQDVQVEVIGPSPRTANGRDNGEVDLREVRADAFAEAFLVPDEALRKHLACLGLLPVGPGSGPSAGDLVRAVEHFGVSSPVLVNRLAGAGLLTPSPTHPDQGENATALSAARSQAAMGTLGFGPPGLEPLDRRLHSLTIRAWREGAISDGEAARALEFATVGGFLEAMDESGERRRHEPVAKGR